MVEFWWSVHCHTVESWICSQLKRRVRVLTAQSCPTLCDPMECSPQGSSVREILQARILKWIAIPFSMGPSQPRDWSWVAHTAGRFLMIWATREALIHLLNPEVKFTSIFPLRLAVFQFQWICWPSSNPCPPNNSEDIWAYYIICNVLSFKGIDYNLINVT